MATEEPEGESPGDETPDAVLSRFDEAQAQYREKYADRPKRYSGRWRGKPRKKRKKRGPVDLGKLVYEQLRKHVPLGALRLERLQQRWPQLVTPRIAKRTWPAKLYGKRLLVLVHDNQWLHELGYLRQDILDRVNREMPDAHVDDLILRLGKVPAPRVPDPGPADVPRKPPLSGEVPQSTRQAIDAVKDPELRAAIQAARAAFGGKTDTNGV